MIASKLQQGLSTGSKYPPFYVHSSLPRGPTKVYGKTDDCVTSILTRRETMSNRESTMDSQSFKNEEFNDLVSSDKPSNQSLSQRFSSVSFRIPCGIFERSKRLFCSGVLLKGSAFALGFWNPRKRCCAIMVAIVLLLDMYFFFYVLCYAFVCKRFDTPLSSWFCGNNSIANSSSASLPAILRGIDLVSILSLVSNFAVLMSNAAFVWCMWKLQRRNN